MHLNPPGSPWQPDTWADIDVLGQWWKRPDAGDIVFLCGCVMTVNGGVITVPPPPQSQDGGGSTMTPAVTRI